jgi:hypothetical protein
MPSEYELLLGTGDPDRLLFLKFSTKQGVAAMSIKALIFGTATMLGVVPFSPHLTLAQQNTYVSPSQAQMNSTALVLIILLGRHKQQHAGIPLHLNTRDVRFPTRALSKERNAPKPL